MALSYEEKMRQVQQLQAQVQGISSKVNAKANALAQKESLLRTGQIPVNNLRDLERNMSKNLGPMLAPGNLGDINKIIWPYFFSTEIPITAPAANQTLQTGFSVTQEASFILMSLTKSAFIQDALDPDKFTYADPNDPSFGFDSTPGLTFTLSDRSSSRQFFNQPIGLSNYGNPRFPTKLPRPVMFLPNQSIQVAFTNSHPTNIYLPFLTAFGYRMRIEDAQNFLGLVYG